MQLDDDDFSLMQLPQRFALDRALLDERWRALQAQVHPDRFATQGTAAQRVAMQWAVRVNEAYKRLKDPLARASYLIDLRGGAVNAQTHTAMPTDFLMQQMAWRESLDEAADVNAVQALDAEVGASQAHRMAALERALDSDNDLPAAADQVRALMFMARFRDDVDRRLEALGA
jgi:molecular chaperone HscB